MNPMFGNVDRPTAVAFARNAQTGEKKTTAAYVIDKDGHRLTKIVDPFNSNPVFYPSWVSPDPVTLLTDVSVDNRGHVWVVDHEKSKIYKFDSELRLLAIHGGEGDGPAKYYYPYGLSFTSAYHWNPATQTADPIPEMAEVILTEKWDATTGVRRLVSGVDIQSFSADYRPRLQSGGGDLIHGSFFVTDNADCLIEFYCNSVLRGTWVSNAVVPGQYGYTWVLPTGAPSGTYEVKLTVNSMNQHGNTVEGTRTAVVDRSITNQRPVVTNIWFPDGDSCFVMGVAKWIRATAYDPNGTIAGYQVQVSRPGTGALYYIRGDSLFFESFFSTAKIPDDHSYLQVFAVDNHGERSSPYYQINFSKLTVYWDYDCICTWKPGDADFNHIYTISDAVYLITYINAGGPAPVPIQIAGDADCNGIITISDAVYMITFLFGGGPAPQCTCNAY